MAEVRFSHLAVLIIVVGGGILAFVFFGSLIGYWLWEGWAVARGYTAAKTPNEAMEKFREAILNRDYDAASRYTTKSYGDLLKQADAPARDLGKEIDQIRSFGKEKGLMTDKLTVVLYALDPFPTNFKMGAAPKEDKDGKKAIGGFEYEKLILKNPEGANFQALVGIDLKELDISMYKNSVGPPVAFTRVELVKEGEGWKLNIATNPEWERAVNNLLAKHKTYHTGLQSFRKNMSSERYDNPGAFDAEIIGKLRSAARQ